MAKKNAGKAPSYQMYPRDWNENQRLKMCSYAAQGLWIRLTNTSYFMEKPGVFCIEGHPLTIDEILDLLPGKTREKRKLFDELKKWKVIKQDGKTFYCKRMKKDMELRKIRTEAGSKGGNPDLVNHEVRNLVNQNSNQTPTPSSSTSSSEKKERKKTPSLVLVRQYFSEQKFRSDPEIFFNWYESHGWPDGDWQALAKVWEARERKPQEGDKTCILDGKAGFKYQAGPDGSRVYLCTECHQLWNLTGRNGGWGKMTKEQIEAVLEGVAV